MPETLETIAAKPDALARDARLTRGDERLTFDDRFSRIDQRLVEMRVYLGDKIDAVGTKLDLICDELVAMREEASIK